MIQICHWTATVHAACRWGEYVVVTTMPGVSVVDPPGVDVPPNPGSRPAPPPAGRVNPTNGSRDVAVDHVSVGSARSTGPGSTPGCARLPEQHHARRGRPGGRARRAASAARTARTPSPDRGVSTHRGHTARRVTAATPHRAPRPR